MDSIEPMQVDDEEGGLARSSEFNIDNPNFDLEAYSNNYTGLVRVKRLMFISKHCTSLQIDALK
jgi:COP9 signalosome complex subunit 1